MVGKSADKANIVRDESLIGSFRIPAIRAQPVGAVNQVNSSIQQRTCKNQAIHP